MTSPKREGLRGLFPVPHRRRPGGPSTTAEKVAQNLPYLLATQLGEHVVRRSYGGGVQHRLQSPNDETLRTSSSTRSILRSGHLPEVRLGPAGGSRRAGAIGRAGHAGDRATAAQRLT